jgi:acetylornithine aminotransferase
LKVFRRWFRPGTTAFFSGFRKTCAAYDVVLILDEVQSGYGRSGKFLHTNIMISKQIICLAKEWGTVFQLVGL